MRAHIELSIRIGPVTESYAGAGINPSRADTAWRGSSCCGTRCRRRGSSLGSLALVFHSLCGCRWNGASHQLLVHLVTVKVRNGPGLEREEL